MVDDLSHHEGNILTTDIVYAMYILTHVKTGKRYVGSSGKVGTRLSSHWSLLKKGKHFVSELQLVFNDNPEINTAFYVTSNRESAYDLEQAYLDKYFDTGELFNRGKDARRPGVGRIVSNEERERVGQQNRGKEFSPEWRAKMSASHLGKVKSPEHLAAIREARTGKPLSPEGKAKIARLNNRMKKRLMGDGIEYRGLMDAALALGVSKENIRHRIRSHLPQWVGWHYIEEELEAT